jgi:hypothetical protein
VSIGDALDTIASLIGDVGRCSARARRYRLTAELAERTLSRTLFLGGEVRAARRSGATTDDALVVVEGELRALLAAAEQAIGDVRATSAYRDALTAWESGRYADVAACAPEIFAGVELVTTPGLLYAPIPVVNRRGGAERFLTPDAVAARVAALLREGVGAEREPADLGADESLPAIVLTETPDLLETPLALVVDPARDGVPVARLVGSGELLVYAPRVSAVGRVRCTAEPDDEWWAVRPNEYARWINALRAALAPHGIELAGGPSAA